jgi:[citrate (pro-3S)-lyase] ligase
MLVENTDYRQEVLDLENPFDVKLVKQFLDPLGFKYKVSELDYTMILYNLNDDIIGTGSLKDNVLKFVAVSPKFRSTTAFAQIVTHLTETALKKDKTAFVYTRPENAEKFEAIGYNQIASAPPTYTLLEFGFQRIQNYQKYLLERKKETKSNNIAAVVVNCNPFTKGHQYLIETAARENEVLYVFVVETNKSVFDFKTRWRLIIAGTKHLDNVVILRGGRYMVSCATFPVYFLKNETVDEITRKQAELDVRVFDEHIVPKLGITKRYVGTEFACNTTNEYNKAMKNILSEHGVEIIELQRKAVGDDLISASKVRQAIKEDRLDDVKEYLPEATREFLFSEASEPIKEKIREMDSRH